MAKGAYIGVGTGTYTVLNYIRSTGTQYIDTGVTGGTNASFEMTARLVSTNSRNNNQMFGTIKNFCSINGTSSAMRMEDANGTMYQFSSTPMEKWTVRVDSDGKIYCNGVYVNTSSVTKGRGWGGTTYGNWLFYTSDDGVNFATSLELYSLKMYTNGVLVRDFVPCVNSSGEVGLFDDANSKFYPNQGTGSFVAGTATGETISKSVARKIKKGYVGVDGKARKIKKAYIGVGGVARPCWSGGELAYYGTIAGLKTAVMAHSATGNGTHAIFAGGMPSGATATAYDASLTQTFPSYFDSMYLSASSAAGYSIFGFGVTFSGSELTTAQRYDNSLTLTSHSGRQRRKLSGATSIGDFVIFAGGGYGNAATTQTVEFFHAPTMTNGTLSNLNYPSYHMGATSVGDYAIFAGGADAQVNASCVKYAVAYDLSTTKTNLTDLSVARSTLGAATVGDYALFAGGNTKSSSSNIVDAYNKSLTRTSAPTLSAAWSEMGATTLGGYAIFAGGMVSGSGRTAKAECYDASLTRTSLPSLSVSRYEIKAATIGNYALFGGGSNGNYQSVVDAYTIA